MCAHGLRQGIWKGRRGKAFFSTRFKKVVVHLSLKIGMHGSDNYSTFLISIEIIFGLRKPFVNGGTF